MVLRQERKGTRERWLRQEAPGYVASTGLGGAELYFKGEGKPREHLKQKTGFISPMYLKHSRGSSVRKSSGEGKSRKEAIVVNPERDDGGLGKAEGKQDG